MRLLLNALCIAALLAVPVALVASTAHAFEAPLGIVLNTDAGATGATQGLNAPSNLTTATPFRINPLVPITVQPSVAAYICVDSRQNIDAGSLLSDGGAGPWSQYRVPVCQQADGGNIGVRVDANVAFPSSCGSADALKMPDGGITSCTVVCVPVTGTSVSCPVWQRQANHSPPEF